MTPEDEKKDVWTTKGNLECLWTQTIKNLVLEKVKIC